jgi:hypothetical protein
MGCITPHFKLGAHSLEPMGKLQVAVKVNTIYQIGLHARRGFGRPEVSQSE